MKNLVGTGFLVLPFLFIGAGFVSSQPVPVSRMVEVRGAALQELHFQLYEEHLARLEAGGRNCR